LNWKLSMPWLRLIQIYTDSIFKTRFCH
jgi:hypothetical protein